MSESLSFIGEIDINQLELVSHSGKKIDISAIVADFGLYEDMFANTMSGYVTIHDSNNLIEEIPLIGQELLNIEIQTPTSNTKIKKSFYVYKCSDRKKLKKRMESYNLYFCSYELIVSSNTKISKSFDGNITDIVEKIFRDNRYLGSKQKLFVNRTKNSYKFIPAFWTPIETINWLSLKAIDSTGAANYLFYETNQSFEFCSIADLLSYEPERKYVYSDVDANTAFTNDDDSKYRIILSLETDVVYDYLKNLKSGMYAGKLYTYDLTTKDIRYNFYDYIEDFNDVEHAKEESYPIHTDTLFRKKAATQFFIEKNNYLNGSYNQQGYSNFFLQRNSLMQQILTSKLLIEVNGRTDIKVGNMIELEIPNNKDIDREELISGEITKNNMSGNYLILAIRHSIINGHHKMLMEVVQDSFLKSVLDIPK